MSNRRASLVLASDPSIVSAIESRVFLNEERSFLPLCKAIYALLDQPSNSDILQTAITALDFFEQLEVLAMPTAVEGRVHSATASAAAAAAEARDSAEALAKTQVAHALRTAAESQAALVNKRYIDRGNLENIRDNVEKLRSEKKASDERVKSRKRKIDLVVSIAHDLSK